MSRIVFLLEEHSMKVFLEGLLPRIFPELEFICITHEGKKDLEKSIPGKLRAWKEPGVRFVVLRDNDNEDCIALKNRLIQLCRRANREDTLVRIVCQELEAWYLGDTNALADAFDNDSIRNIGRKTRFRKPDELSKPSREIKQLIPGFQKVTGARRMAQTLERDKNISPSFQILISGVEKLFLEMTMKA